MATESLNIFISYSRENTKFVDRLDADLQARGFRSWVDRQRLEGGQLWEQEIYAAIARADLFLIVLSQAAAESPYVRKEVEAAVNANKRLLPLIFQTYQSHPWLAQVEERQFQYFTNPASYNTDLTKLLYVIIDPTLDLSKEDDSLYSFAISLRVTDPERALIVLQHLADRNPQYFGGQVKKDLADLQAQIYALRLSRLRAQAEDAHQEGQYGVEAASLESLISLSGGQKNQGTLTNKDDETIAWAKEYLPIAQRNRDMLGPYGVIQDRIAAGDTTTARELLQRLWEQAPYFRDPAGIAPSLGLKLPSTYLYDKLNAENENYQRARELMQKGIPEGAVGYELSNKLSALNYELPEISGRVLCERWASYRSRQANAHFPIEVANSERTGRIITAAIGLVILAAIICGWSTSQNQVFLGIVILGGITALVVAYVYSKNQPSVERIASVKDALAAAELEARQALEKRHQTAQQVHQERVNEINRQLAGIAPEH